MIRNIEAYRQTSEAEYWQELGRMSIEDTIELGEALLTSEVFDARSRGSTERVGEALVLPLNLDCSSDEG